MYDKKLTANLPEPLSFRCNPLLPVDVDVDVDVDGERFKAKSKANNYIYQQKIRD